MLGSSEIISICFPPAVPVRNDPRALVFLALNPAFIAEHVPEAQSKRVFVNKDSINKWWNKKVCDNVVDGTQWLIGYLPLDPNDWTTTIEDVIQGCKEAVENKGQTDLLIGEGCLKTFSMTEFKEYVYEWQQKWGALGLPDDFHFVINENGLEARGTALTDQQKIKSKILLLKDIL